MRTAALLVALLLAAAACSDGDGNVRPFSEIQASELSFEADPLDPGRAIFRVTTTEPAICSIAWGPSEALGNQNNSLSMNGTGIVQHDVILPGATAGETYFFRLQGSTADGQLFQSEVATFTVPESEAGPAGDPGPDRGPNLARGATVVDVSSEFNASFGAANALDGDPATEWSTRGDGDGGFITIDLGSVQEIGGLEFITRSMADGSAITTEYTVSIDGSDPLGPYPSGSPADRAFQEVATSGRVLRFEITSSTGGNTGAVDVGVYGPTS